MHDAGGLCIHHGVEKRERSSPCASLVVDSGRLQLANTTTTSVNSTLGNKHFGPTKRIRIACHRFMTVTSATRIRSRLRLSTNGKPPNRGESRLRGSALESRHDLPGGGQGHETFLSKPRMGRACYGALSRQCRLWRRYL